jgi:TPR repeat protein
MGELAGAGVTEGVAAYEQANYQIAHKELRPAAENGDAVAQYYLASMYRFGKGVSRDSKLAVVWYRKAAEQGYAQAQMALGLKYAKGCGVPYDRVQAYVWLKLAADQGVDTAANVRDGLASDMTPGQIAEACAQLRAFRDLGTVQAQTSPAAYPVSMPEHQEQVAKPAFACADVPSSF